MTEENNPPKRVVRQTFQGKFGVSDNPADHGFGRHPEVTDPDAQETRSERREFERSKERNSGSDERKFDGSRGERKPFDRERRSFGDRERTFDRERRSFGDRDRRSFRDRDAERSFDRRERSFDRDREDRRSFRDRERPFDRERRPFGDRDRRSFRDRDGERSFDRRERSFDRNREGRRSFGDRGRSFDRNENRPVFRQRPEQKFIEDDEAVRDEEAVLQYADSPDILPEKAGANPPWFRKLLALTTEKGRSREGQFIAEGVRVVEEIVANHQDVIIGIYAAGKKKLDESGEPVLNEEGENVYEPIPTLQELIDRARKAGASVKIIGEDQVQRLSSTVTPQGILAVCRMASTKPNYEKSRSILTLVDAVQDPGNLGAIFRTSLGFSSSGIVIGKGSVNPFNPKVIRGSSGTFLRVPFEKDRDLIETINELHRYGYTIIATDLHGKQSLSEIEPRKLRKVAFLVGNEGAGTDRHLIDISDETVRIPMSSELESLNVAVAHGILSYEMAKIQKELG